MVDSAGVLDAGGAAVLGEVLVDRYRGDVALGLKARSIELARLNGSINLAGAAQRETSTSWSPPATSSTCQAPK